MTFKEPEDEEFDRIEREQEQRTKTFKQDYYASLSYTVPKNVISFHTIESNPEPVLVIAKDGEVTWRGKVVESDDEFKLAMIDLSKYFAGKDKPFPRRLSKAEVTLVWTTKFPPNGTINADTFVYEFADALQTYLGIGD